MRQNEQLQRRAVFRPSLNRTVKRTVPQWQAAWSGREKSRLVLGMVVSIKGQFCGERWNQRHPISVKSGSNAYL
ncbi:hypothetical protein [Comamonas thiooxydans]|uniref:hypothetical protein n=1 Tax=Comamonas thiooxydans TaxID=363952 RepID=UPI001F5FB7DE|nr:hypothetical protein [Comamonas thiooxydans]